MTFLSKITVALLACSALLFPAPDRRGLEVYLFAAPQGYGKIKRDVGITARGEIRSLLKEARKRHHVLLKKMVLDMSGKTVSGKYRTETPYIDPDTCGKHKVYMKFKSTGFVFVAKPHTNKDDLVDIFIEISKYLGNRNRSTPLEKKCSTPVVSSSDFRKTVLIRVGEAVMIGVFDLAKNPVSMEAKTYEWASFGQFYVLINMTCQR